IPVLGGFLPARFQQIVNASFFTGAGAIGPITIVGMALRPGTDDNAISGDLNLSLLAGTTSVDPNTGCSFPSGSGCAYGSSFLDTSGSTTVVSGVTHFATTFPGTNPRSFDFLLTFTTPFSFDPTVPSNNFIFDLNVFSI